MVTDDVMRQALAMQLNIPFLDLDSVELARALGRIINKNYARRHSLVPVCALKQTLTISMNDPTNSAVIEELSQTTGMMVNVVTSSAESIKRAFQRLLRRGAGRGTREGDRAAERRARSRP